jgi:hypothetical protein
MRQTVRGTAGAAGDTRAAARATPARHPRGRARGVVRDGGGIAHRGQRRYGTGYHGRRGQGHRRGRRQRLAVGEGEVRVLQAVLAQVLARAGDDHHLRAARVEGALHVLGQRHRARHRLGRDRLVVARGAGARGRASDQQDHREDRARAAADRGVADGGHCDTWRS